MKTKRGLFFCFAVLVLTAMFVLAGCDNSTNGGGNGGGGNGTSTPGTPTNVAATAQSSSSIRITWSPPSSGGTPSWYNIWRSTSAYGEYTQIGSIFSPTTSYTDTYLSASTSYYYKVDAENSAPERSPQSSYASATTQSSGGGGTTTVPSIPTGVTATAQSSSSVSISWAPVSGASSYDVYYEIGSSSTKNFADNVAGTSYTHTGLQASTIYYYYIKAKNSAGESGYSSYASATTSSSGGNGGGVPGRVSSGTVTVQSSTSLRLTWETVSGATGYSIYRAVLSSDPPSTPTYYVSGGNTNSYTDASLTTGSLYRYWITAVNSAGESDQRYLGSGVPTTPSTNTLNAPTGVMTTVLSSSSIRVSWNEVSGATGYRVYYGSAGDSNPTLYYSVEGRTSYDFSYLYSGSVYYYKVSAVSSAGVGPASSLVTAVPTAAPSGYGSIKIENNSSIWMITLVQIKEQGAVGLVYNEVYDIEPGDYELYNYIPAGKTYDVFIMDSYLDGYNRSVTLSTNQTVTLSYNGTSFTIK